MERELQSIKLTKEVYLEISADKTAEIASLKQDKDEKTSEIGLRVAYLKELRTALKEVKKKIKFEKRALSVNRREKFSIKRELSKQNRYAKRINKAFSRGDETIERNSFYTQNEKAR